MKRSYIALGGVLLFVCLLIVNLIFKVSPDNNEIIGVFIVLFLILFFAQRRKDTKV
jgi:drug/metabolite transporter superfamily protein YnfA